MADPALAVQTAALDALKKNIDLYAIVRGRIYDTTPASAAGAVATFPYVTLGEGQTIPERADCLDGSEHYFTVHAWSRSTGFPECKRMASAIRDTLHDAEIEVAGFRLIDLAMQDAQFLRDPDGLTSHCAMSFRALLEPLD